MRHPACISIDLDTGRETLDPKLPRDNWKGRTGALLQTDLVGPVRNGEHARDQRSRRNQQPHAPAASQPRAPLGGIRLPHLGSDLRSGKTQGRSPTGRQRNSERTPGSSARLSMSSPRPAASPARPKARNATLRTARPTRAQKAVSAISSISMTSTSRPMTVPPGFQFGIPDLSGNLRAASESIGRTSLEIEEEKHNP
jgi:hypothetical protein